MIFLFALNKTEDRQNSSWRADKQAITAAQKEARALAHTARLARLRNIFQIIGGIF